MKMTQYLEIFLEETQEHLDKLNRDLLELETNPGNKEILDDIFRSAHTLKGMSATMGFTKIAELTHEMENILSGLRDHHIKPSVYVVDILFDCLDTLGVIIKEIAREGHEVHSISDILNKLRYISDNGQWTEGPDNLSKPFHQELAALGLNEFEKGILKEAAELGFGCYHITVFLKPECVLKSARAFMVFRNLEQVGEVIKCYPPVQEIEEEKFDNSFQIILVSERPQKVIRKSIASIAEINEPLINRINLFLTKSDQNPEKPVIHGIQKNFTSQIVRVDKTKLDTVMNLVGELVINKTRLEQIGRASQNSELLEILEQMGRITGNLQDVVMKARMVPLDNVFSRFPRMVRDLARDLQKEIDLVIEGKDTELDRTVIDEIGDPLVHILRNCIDHGIEKPEERLTAGKKENGKVSLVARYEGNNVVIEVHDDGRGIDPQKIKKAALDKGIVDEEMVKELDTSALVRLILLPGFTTAPEITGVSGRGVGLDAVKTKIESLNGSIEITSTPGVETRFKIKLPLTLAITKALIVSVETEIYAIPLSYIVETTSLMPADVQRIQGQEFINLRGELIELVRLSHLLQIPELECQPQELDIVIVRKEEKKVGLIVGTLIGQQEIVVKPLSKLFGDAGLFAGATILGNGDVSLIIDIGGIF